MFCLYKLFINLKSQGTNGGKNTAFKYNLKWVFYKAIKSYIGTYNQRKTEYQSLGHIKILLFLNKQLDR